MTKKFISFHNIFVTKLGYESICDSSTHSWFSLSLFHKSFFHFQPTISIHIHSYHSHSSNKGLFAFVFLISDSIKHLLTCISIFSLFLWFTMIRYLKVCCCIFHLTFLLTIWFCFMFTGNCNIHLFLYYSFIFTLYQYILIVVDIWVLFYSRY